MSPLLSVKKIHAAGTSFRIRPPSFTVEALGSNKTTTCDLSNHLPVIGQLTVFQSGSVASEQFPEILSSQRGCQVRHNHACAGIKTCAHPPHLAAVRCTLGMNCWQKKRLQRIAVTQYYDTTDFLNVALTIMCL